MALEMKYFVLKPKGKTKDDPYAIASREAMRTYALTIQETNPELCHDLLRWIDIEEGKEDGSG